MKSFTKNDENFVEAFAIFCGMGIHNTHMYEKAIVAMAKQSVTLEVLSYHASASMDDAGRLRVISVFFIYLIRGLNNLSFVKNVEIKNSIGCLFSITRFQIR